MEHQGINGTECLIIFCFFSIYRAALESQPWRFILQVNMPRLIPRGRVVSEFHCYDLQLPDVSWWSTCVPRPTLARRFLEHLRSRSPRHWKRSGRILSRRRPLTVPMNATSSPCKREKFYSILFLNCFEIDPELYWCWPKIRFRIGTLPSTWVGSILFCDCQGISVVVKINDYNTKMPTNMFLLPGDATLELTGKSIDRVR